MVGSLEPTWLTLDAVVAMNRDEVARSGEAHKLQDRAALQRALAHPWNMWVYFMDRDIAVLAARLYTGARLRGRQQAHRIPRHGGVHRG